MVNIFCETEYLSDFVFLVRQHSESDESSSEAAADFVEEDDDDGVEPSSSSSRSSGKRKRAPGLVFDGSTGEWVEPEEARKAEAKRMRRREERRKLREVWTRLNVAPECSRTCWPV